MMGSRQVRIGCDFVYEAQVDTPTVFQVTPLGVDGVDINGERWSFAPQQESHEYRDIYGNRCQRIVLPTGRSQITYEAVATSRTPPRTST